MRQSPPNSRRTGEMQGRVREGGLLRRRGWVVATGAGGRTGLIGRDQELAELSGLLRRRWLVTLTGAPGVGKSRLALATVSNLDPAAEVAVVALGSARDPALVAPAVADALDLDEPACRPLGEAIAAQGARRVVVLDDCDHVLGAAAELAQALGAAGLRVLATSQQPLGIDGEALWRVGPLSLPPPGGHAMPAMFVGSDAVRLFCERAAEVRRGFVPTPVTDPAVAEICRRLDGHPLAIESAARRIDVLSPAEILARLDQDPVAFLAAPQRPSSSPRHGSLATAIAAGYDRLPIPERVLWTRLSIFAGGFGLEAAQAVCAAGEVGADQVFEVLAALVAASLVEADTTCSPSRYRMLEPLRDCARQRLDDAGGAAAVAAAHGRWCLKLVEQAGDPAQGQPWVKRLAPEHANIEAAWRWALCADEAQPALGLARAHAYLCRAAGRHREGRAALTEASSLLGPAAPPALAASALVDAGAAAAVAGDLATAAAHLDQGLAVARRAGVVAAEARALAMAGMVATISGEHAGNLAALEQAVALARTVDEEPCLIAALAAAGHAYLLVGQPSEARACFAESLTGARRRGDDFATADALVGAGRGALAQGEYPEAEEALTEGLGLAIESSEVHTQTVALAGLGELALLQGDDARARQRFGECAQLAREAATTYPLALALIGLGRLAQAADDLPAARAMFEEALVVARKSTLAHLIPPCLVGLGQLGAAGGDPEAAQRLFNEALAAACGCGNRAGKAQALSELGLMASATGDDARASSLHHQALALQAEMGDPASIADSLQALAGPAAANGRFAHAARLLGAAHSIRQTHGYVAAPRDRDEYDAHVRVARERLEDEPFDAAWDQGAGLSTEEAVAYASRGRGGRGRPSTGWEALTPAERGVVALAQQGLTNAQIAERLFISRRTVDAHLAHVFTKLGITSRMQLTTAPREPADPGSER